MVSVFEGNVMIKIFDKTDFEDMLGRDIVELFQKNEIDIVELFEFFEENGSVNLDWHDVKFLLKKVFTTANG
jgi:hypothetical protein